jgi:hypothetical protein
MGPRLNSSKVDREISGGKYPGPNARYEDEVLLKIHKDTKILEYLSKVVKIKCSHGFSDENPLIFEKPRRHFAGAKGARPATWTRDNAKRTPRPFRAWNPSVP